MRGLQGKVAIVADAASPRGLGFATATRLAEEGARVVLTDINQAAVVERAAQFGAAGHSAIGLAHDALGEATWEEVLRATKAEFGQLDIMVNNAAICTLSHVVDWHERAKAALPQASVVERDGYGTYYCMFAGSDLAPFVKDFVTGLDAA